MCESAIKPLMFFYLVHARNVTNALVFTKSAESTARLVRLLEFFEAALQAWQSQDRGREVVVARAYSSDLAPGERKAILEQFKNQKIHMYVTCSSRGRECARNGNEKGTDSCSIDRLVCSDLISRGIDISHVSHVVSYDVPVDFRKYVHRVGRTARAGRAGDAWTLVEEQEVRHVLMPASTATRPASRARERVADRSVAGAVFQDNDEGGGSPGESKTLESAGD